MISIISGTIEEKTADSIVVMTPGGIGFLVNAPTGVISSAGKTGDRIRLYTYMYVREDIIQLIGFASAAERDMFLRLISISGVGPKAALAILSAVSLTELSMAIASSDAKTITRAQGVGKKMADRIILELRGKIDLPDSIDMTAVTAAPAPGSAEEDAVQALMPLGYTYQEAAAAVKKVSKPGMDLQDIISAALRSSI